MLRGINVGGNKKIKMDALRQMYTELGFSYVQSFIQSGNVVFSCAEKDIKTLEKSISDGILNTFGFEVPTLVLNAVELANTLTINPFISDKTKDASYIHLTFLSVQPNDILVEKLSPLDFTPDEFQCIGKTVYLYCPNGYGNTKLNNTFFEKKLKIVATTRNLRTCNELLNRTRIE